MSNFHDIRSMRSFILAFFCLHISFASVWGQGDTPRYNHTVLLNNSKQTIPLQGLGKKNIAVITSADPVFDQFFNVSNKYAPVSQFRLPKTALEVNSLDEQLKFYNTLIFAVAGHELHSPQLQRFIETKAVGKTVVLAIFEHGNTLRYFELSRFPILYHNQLSAQSVADVAMSVFGGLACNAKLDRSYSLRYAQGAGQNSEQTRITYGDAYFLSAVQQQELTSKIDQIVAEAIREKATPGAVVMVVKNGHVVFEKGYGRHTYDSQAQPTRVADIFDMASITKIAATTPVVMHLTERGVIQLDSTMGHYLLQAQETNKANTTLRSVMLHEAGFIPYIPFHQRLKPDDLSRDSSSVYSVKVADGCYVKSGFYEQVMWPTMLETKLNTAGSYVYSDISMYVMKEVAEHQTGIPMPKYLQQHFYRPLGMQTAGFNPRQRFEKTRIVPTENDQEFRKTLLQGYVHDQGAALAGGVAGHAGMFASANDLAIYGQLLLNRGEYGGERYFKGETVDRFTSNQSETSRRGLGFDRADPDKSKNYPSTWASDATFGHTGYTGTCIWIDPKEQLVYIFLSNRVHPQVTTQLMKLNIRSRIQDAVYEILASPNRAK